MILPDKFNNQYVRDLAWVIFSPPLIKNSPSLQYDFLDKYYWRNEYNNFLPYLRELDKKPYELIHFINNGNTNLLGKYFEALVEFWLRKSKDKELITVNLQVFKGRKTIGEFDFVYRDLETKKVIHLECAGKFYISRKLSKDWTNFIGPNSLDSLDRKLHKLFNDQITLSETEEGRENLYLEGVEEEVFPKILLKGYLFYYADFFANRSFIPPEFAEDEHPKGWWIYERDLNYFFSGKENSKWTIIERKNWISNIYNPQPEPVYDVEVVKEKLNEYFRTDEYPLLLAELNKNEEDIYEEVSRGFIVSNNWPGTGF